MNIDKIQDDLEQLMTAGIVKSHENLKDHVYTKMGGKADILAAPATYDEIQKIVTYAEQNGITLTVLGNGSNVIIRDGGYVESFCKQQDLPKWEFATISYMRNVVPK